MSVKESVKEIEEYTKNHVKQSRFEHCCRVASMCVDLCKMFGIPEEKGYLAGIGHDMCKEFSPEKIIEIAEKGGYQLTDYDKKNPSILHGISASVLMKNQFRVQDEDVLNAVETHVSGSIIMCDLAKILYISDKAEPGRKYSTQEYRQSLFKLSLNDMFKKVLTESYEYVLKKGYEIYPKSKQVVDYYMEQKK